MTVIVGRPKNKHLDGPVGHVLIIQRMRVFLRSLENHPDLTYENGRQGQGTEGPSNSGVPL